MRITHYTLQQYQEAMRLKNHGLGSLRISKILGIKNRNAVESWIHQGRKPYYFSEARIRASNSQENIERMRVLNKITQPSAVKASALLRTKRLPDSAKILDEHLAYILGVVYGDAHVSLQQRRIILSATDYDFVDTFRFYLHQWSHFEVRFFSRNIKKPYYIKTRKLQWVAYIDSLEASRFLYHFKISLLHQARVEIRASFLKGFFDSEGCIMKDGSLFAYNTKYNTILFVQNLLHSLGIQTNIRSYSGYTLDKSKRILQYCLRVLARSRERFKNLVGFTIQRKQHRLVNACLSKRVDKGVQRMEEVGMSQQDDMNEMREDQEYSRQSGDEHTVFVGAKPFMNPR